MNQDNSSSVIKFKKAIDNLLIVIIFTAVNLILSILKADVYLLFSATIPQFAFELGKLAADEFSKNAYFIIGLATSIAIISAYFICWLLAKRSRVLILVAFILFVLDTALLLFLASISENFSSYLLDIAFHAWVLYYLFHGTVAWKKLRKMDKNEFSDSLNEMKENETRALPYRNPKEKEDKK